MTRADIHEEYFEWLYNLVCGTKRVSYRKLLGYLYNTDFRYLLRMDGNRAEDGISLRYRFALILGFEDVPEAITDALEGPCSVLEMMVALSIRCEESIMDDPNVGNRAGQWFWNMIVNLGLGSMSDERFNPDIVENAIETFLNRNYESDGTGGLFIIRNCDRNLREMEIWHQMCWYLDSIV